MINGRLAVPTSLGDLIVDSGAARLVLFGVEPDGGFGDKREWRTVAGSQKVGIVFGKDLIIEGRKVWRGDAVAIPSQAEPEVAGLLAAQFVQGNLRLQFGRLRYS